VITCCVSIDYLTDPLHVLSECKRVLRPGGKMIISQSDRFFPSKVVNLWLQLNNNQRTQLINGYFQYNTGWSKVEAWDCTPDTSMEKGLRDPLFIVEAVKA